MPGNGFCQRGNAREVDFNTVATEDPNILDAIDFGDDIYQEALALEAFVLPPTPTPAPAPAPNPERFVYVSAG